MAFGVDRMAYLESDQMTVPHITLNLCIVALFRVRNRSIVQRFPDKLMPKPYFESGNNND